VERLLVDRLRCRSERLVVDVLEGEFDVAAGPDTAFRLGVFREDILVNGEDILD